MLFGQEDLREKINKVYNKKYKNYNNIELFSTIDYNVIVSPPILEGLISDTKPGANKSVNDAKKLGSAYKTTFDKITDSNLDIDASGNIKKEESEISKITNAGKKFYAKVKAKKNSITSRLNDIGETVTNPGKMKADGKNATSSAKDNNGNPVEPPSTFKNILLHIQSIFSFVLNFINNTLVYISIILVQFIYGDKPILPWGNIKRSFTMTNWPWKLNLNVSPSDNLVMDPSATLYDKTGDPVPDGNGGSISAEQYNTNQKILYDANIVFNLFTQIILVSLTWVFTNNAYYYIYNDESLEIKSSSFPYRVILPKNQQGGVNVDRGFTGIIPFAFVNTLVTSSYDMLFLLFYVIKFVTQYIGLYEFRALNYILIFLVILWFSLSHFWNIYNNFMEEPFAYVFNPFFAIFIIYGLYQHFFTVTIVSSKNEKVSDSRPIATAFLHFCSFFIIFSLLIAVYPIIRMFFYFWSIYVFLGLQGFGNNTYDDVMKNEGKKTCDSNKVTIIKIIREIIQSFFQYFFYFVVFVLIISNFIYLNTIPTFNSSSSSSMKIFLIIIFLFVFMFLVYSLLNKNNAKKSKIVVYGDSYIKEEAPVLGDIVNKIDMPKFDTPTESKSKTTGKVVKTPEEVVVKTPEEVVETTGEELVETSGEEPEKPISVEYINALKTKIENLLETLNNNDNPILATLVPANNNHILVFKNTLTNILEILNSPIVTELIHTPFYITKLVKKIEENTSIPDNIKPYISVTKQLLKEIINEKLDVRISNFINEVSNIPFTTDISENIAKINDAFTKEITEMNYKIARILKRVFPNETSNAISITQIYNTPALTPLFVNAEPEMAIFSMIVSKIYPEETKGGIINSLTSAAKVARNTFR